MKISTAKPATAFYNTKKNNSALTISSFLAAKTLQRTLINYRVQSLPVSHRHKFLRNVCQLWKQETCNYFLYSYFLMNFVKLFSQHRQTSATLIGIWLIAFRKWRSAAASLYLNIKKKTFQIDTEWKTTVCSFHPESSFHPEFHHWLNNGSRTPLFALKHLVWDWMSSQDPDCRVVVWLGLGGRLLTRARP